MSSSSYEDLGYVPATRFRTRHMPSPDARDGALFAYPEPGAGQINGVDDRVLVRDPTRPPYRFICALDVLLRDGTTRLRGTGWLAGPRTIVTAGHCLFVRRVAGATAEVRPYDGAAVRVRITSPLPGAPEPLEADRFEAAPEWCTQGNPDADLGAIFLDDDRLAPAGWFAFGAARPAAFAGLRLNLAGYPDDRDRGTKQYYAGRVADRVEGGRLVYETDTYHGQSGAPLWVNLGGKRVVVGIHTMGVQHLARNSGVLITEGAFHRLREWKLRR